MLDAIQSFTESLPLLLRWLGILLAGAVPFIESYIGSALGVIAGLHPVVAVLAASLGNFSTVLLVVHLTGTARDRVRKGGQPSTETPRRVRLRRAFDKWGVPGVSLIGQTILPSQITSAALISFGAPRPRVLLWQGISIVLWGCLFAALTMAGVNLVQ